MSDKTNITVQDAVEQMMKNVSFNFDSGQVYGKSPLAQYTYKDDTLSERHENLLERFPAKDIGDIRKLENTLDTFEHSDISMENISEMCLENDIVSPEIFLMDVMFSNNLKTASRNGITLLNIDGSLEIRNDEEKFLSPDETNLMRDYLTGEDDDLPPGIQGYDIARETTTTSGGNSGGGRSSFQHDIKTVNVEFSQDDRMKVKSELEF